MNGKRYLLDTNAIIALLQGNSRLNQLLQDADWVGISVISQIEFLAFSGLTTEDLQLFQQFLQRIEIIDLSGDDSTLIKKIIEIRQQYHLELPDAIIAAMAIAEFCEFGNCRSRVTEGSRVKDNQLVVRF